MDFLKWINTNHKNLVLEHLAQYVCYDKNNILTNISKFNDHEISKLRKECFPEPWMTVVLTIGATLGIISVLVLLICAYRNRWKIKYQIFKLEQHLENWLRRTPEDQEGDKRAWKYDAYVSYCNLDRFWVHNVLLNHLEKCYSFRLCIRMRDFPVGETIAQTIINHISESREIIVVVSDLSLSREWCTFELEHARIQAERRKKKLIVVKLGELNNIAENSIAAHILDSNSVLEWDDNFDGQVDNSHKTQYFWQRLVKRLYGTAECACCILSGRKNVQLDAENLI